MITVKELKEHLNSFNDDAVVILSKDAEGNGYSPLSDFSMDCFYEETSTWDGEIVWPDNYEEDDERGTPCIVLWPTN